MIPKIIHYCWFGPNKKSEVAERCIASWKQHAPDFELKEWNEHNTKEYQNKFYKDAYRKKEFAFVADVIRVQALQEQGGIYMDLDMLLLTSLDSLLTYRFFSGNEVAGRVAYGLFGGEPQHRFFKAMTAFYDKTPFNQFSLPVITHTFKALINENTLEDNEQLVSVSYFYALTYENREKPYQEYLTKESIAVHLWDHSWGQKSESNTYGTLFKNLRIVGSDFLLYGYPWSYAKRYLRGFLRKIAHKLMNK